MSQSNVIGWLKDIVNQLHGPIARSTVGTTAVLGLRLLVQAATLLVLARVLGPASFGAFAGMISLAVLVGALSTWGTHLTLLRDLSRDQPLRDQSLCLALGATRCCSFVLLVVYVAAASAVLPAVKGLEWPIALFGIAEIVVQPFLMLAATEPYARNEVARTQLLLTLPLAIRLAAAILVWMWGPDNALLLYAIGHLLAVLVALAVGIRALRKSWPSWNTWRFPRFKEAIRNGGFALQGLTGAGPSELDKTLAVRLLPLSAAGVYAISSRVIGAVVIPVIALILSALPRLFRESAVPSRVLLQWLFIVAAAYGAGASLALWGVAPWIERLFGPDYRGVTEQVRWLALAVLPLSLRIVGSNILTTLDMAWPRVGLEGLGLALLALLAWGLTDMSGQYGMALAIIITEASLAAAFWMTVIFGRQRIRGTL